jgi:hypothetical protein
MTYNVDSQYVSLGTTGFTSGNQSENLKTEYLREMTRILIIMPCGHEVALV